MRVAVFGSSRADTPQAYLSQAFELGKLLADRGHICVNGGGGAGVMGAANKGVRAGKGEVIGIIHEMFCVDTDEDRQIPNMIVAKGQDLNERKNLLIENSDGFIVMPGGTGTFDELWDIVSHRSLGMKGLKGKPIVICNLNGFYDGSIQQLNRAYADKILYNSSESYFTVVTNAKDALDVVEKQFDALAATFHSMPKVDNRMSKRAVFPIASYFSNSLVLCGVSFAGGVIAALAVTRLRK